MVAGLVAMKSRPAVVVTAVAGEVLESVADAAMARAEFVLGRQERHRGAMNELMQRLKDESASFELALSKERSSIEQAIQALGGEAQKFENVTGDTERHLELIMSNAATRASQLTSNFMRERVRSGDSRPCIVRSVMIAEDVSKRLRTAGYRVKVVHRDSPGELVVVSAGACVCGERPIW